MAKDSAENSISCNLYSHYLQVLTCIPYQPSQVTSWSRRACRDYEYYKIADVDRSWAQ